MANLQISREEVGGSVTLRLRGAIDASAAATLRAELDRLGGSDVVVDFTRVGEFQDLAVPILSRGLSTHSSRLVGLGHHHERLFRYFGVGLAPLPRGAEETAAA